LIGIVRNYASFWRRSAGWLIDGLLIGVVFVCVGQIMLANAPAWLAPLVWIGPWIYLISLTAGGATIGQRAVGIKTIDDLNGVPGYFRSMKRAMLPAAVTLFPTWLIDVLLSSSDPTLNEALGYSAIVMLIALSIWILDHCWMILNDRKQTLHDKMAGTYVVWR
jgi:uncharacterized RDD family membrane protein YckC